LKSSSRPRASASRISVASAFEPTLMARRMFETFGPRLGITEDENDFACKEAWIAQNIFDKDVESKGRAILETVESENRVTILMVARPYHSDPGLNHGIPEEFQVLGYAPAPFSVRDIIAIARGFWWSLNGRIDRIEARLERIERRLDLVEGPAA